MAVIRTSALSVSQEYEEEIYDWKYDNILVATNVNLACKPNQVMLKKRCFSTKTEREACENNNEQIQNKHSCIPMNCFKENQFTKHVIFRKLFNCLKKSLLC